MVGALFTICSVKDGEEVMEMVEMTDSTRTEVLVQLTRTIYYQNRGGRAAKKERT